MTQWDSDKLDLLAVDHADMSRQANQIVKKVLADHRVPALDENLIQAGNDIIKVYEKEVS